MRRTRLLIFCTLLHFSVDGVCAACLADYAVNEPDYADVVYFFGLYSVIAFGGQWFVGLILDKCRKLILPSLAIVPVILAGGFFRVAGIFWQVLFVALGNCIFHVAAGILVLERYEGFREPGIFVSSGAVGLGLGLHHFVGMGAFWMACAFFTAVTVSMLAGNPEPSAGGELSGTRGGNILPFMAGAFMLLSCVILRGFGVRSDAALHVMVMPCVFMLGKSAGGILCDAVGWRKTILAVFLLSFAATQIHGAIGAVILSFSFNMTMPLTLRLLHLYFPEYPGLTFGLAAGCLLPGAFFGEYFGIPDVCMMAVQFIGLFFAGAIFRHYRREGQYSPQFSR